jgi:predicted metal-dependent HD superfamily phosphohydrolase
MTTLDKWRETWRELGSPAADEALFQKLVVAYSEPHRKYHTLQHLAECFEQLERVRDEAERAGEIELGLWFHDAIYDTRRHDNEERSADWARASVLCAGLPASIAERVFALIMSTRHDAAPRGQDETILVDVDLSILGAASERFDEYERQVRAEYSWVPEPVFRTKRCAILQAFLARPTLFNTATFIAAYEANARRNLERSLKRCRTE